MMPDLTPLQRKRLERRAQRIKQVSTASIPPPAADILKQPCPLSQIENRRQSRIFKKILGLFSSSSKTGETISATTSSAVHNRSHNPPSPSLYRRKEREMRDNLTKSGSKTSMGSSSTATTAKSSSSRNNSSCADVKKIGKIAPSHQAYNDIILEGFQYNMLDDGHFTLRKSIKKQSISTKQPAFRITTKYEVLYQGQVVYEVVATSCDFGTTETTLGLRSGRTCLCKIQGSQLVVKMCNMGVKYAHVDNVGEVTNSNRVESYTIDLEELVHKSALAQQDTMLFHRKNKKSRHHRHRTPPSRTSAKRYEV